MTTMVPVAPARSQQTASRGRTRAGGAAVALVAVVAALVVWAPWHGSASRATAALTLGRLGAPLPSLTSPSEMHLTRPCTGGAACVAADRNWVAPSSLTFRRAATQLDAWARQHGSDRPLIWMCGRDAGLWLDFDAVGCSADFGSSFSKAVVLALTFVDPLVVDFDQKTAGTEWIPEPLRRLGNDRISTVSLQVVVGDLRP